MAAGQQRIEISSQHDETGYKEDDMAAFGGPNVQNEYGGIVENIAAVDSEPEEGRERDQNHRQKDADGTGENVEGDLDGDGDLSNSNLNDEDIMGDEAHSAPAGGDFQEGDFDGEERSRGEEGGCREMINDGEDGIEQQDFIDEGIMQTDSSTVQEYVRLHKKFQNSAVVESTQVQYGTQGASKFQMQIGGSHKYHGNRD